MCKLNREIIIYLFVTLLISVILAGCGGITMKNYTSSEEQYREAYKEFQKKHYVKAIDGFQKVVYNFSGSPMVDSAQYYLAMSYYLDKEYYLAAAEFERVVNNYPGSDFVDDSQYMAGLCYFKSSPKNAGLDQNELIRALEVLNDFVTDYPESELVDDARATIKVGMDRLAKKRYQNGQMYFKLAYYKSAQIYFQTVIDEHTDSDWAAQALYYLAEIDLNKKDYSDAKEKFINFLVIYPEHDLTEKAQKKLVEAEEKIAKSTETN
ncbi:MAG: outer membrane protein assembly factor BamD [Candidatus Zixiibacteriota bacterium]